MKIEYVVEILRDGSWIQASMHTLMVDAEAQRARFIADAGQRLAGVTQDQTRIVEVEVQ